MLVERARDDLPGLVELLRQVARDDPNFWIRSLAADAVADAE